MTVPGSVVAARSDVAVPGVDPARVTFRPLPVWTLPLLAGRVRAMALGNTVLVHPDGWDRVISGNEPELVAHELIHVRQWSEDGIVGFLMRYLGDYLRLRMLGCRHEDAYRNIRYEWSAYSAATHIVQRP